MSNNSPDVKSLLPPPDLFCQIESIVKEKPHLLTVDNWHTAGNGNEAKTIQQIVHPATSHDLMGWIVMKTPGALSVEGIETDDLAHMILANAGRPRIPRSIVFGEVEDLRKILAGRAAEERSLNDF